MPKTHTLPVPFPADFLTALNRYAEFTDLEALKEASNRPLRKCVRVNTLKCTVDAFARHAAEKNWKLTPVPWCPEGFFVDREDHSVALGKDLLHLLGHFYMQEASSQLPAELLDAQPGEVILDMSAAPGSKSTQIADAMRGRGVLVCNDIQEKRLWTLKSGLHRSGVTNYVMTKKVGQWFGKHMTERFDRVLCDAPCSAQGTVRKDSDALDYCSADNIGKMAKIQKELLESAIHATKIGGRIVYSTCTLTPEENEGVVAWVLEKFKGKLEVVDPRKQSAMSDERSALFSKMIEDSFVVQKSLSLTADHLPLLRLWPQTADTEGFFCAVLKKTAPTRSKEFFDAEKFQEEPIPPARQAALGKVCEKLYGDSFLREGERLFQRGDQLLLSTEEVEKFKITVQDYALGIPYARRLDMDRIRIAQETVSLRGQSATHGVIELTQPELNGLLNGKDIPCDAELRGDPILRYNGIPVGSSLAKEGKLWNRLPRWIVAKS